MLLEQLGPDSLWIVELSFEIEKSFGIHFNAREVSSFHSVKDVVDISFFIAKTLVLPPAPLTFLPLADNITKPIFSYTCFSHICSSFLNLEVNLKLS